MGYLLSFAYGAVLAFAGFLLEIGSFGHFLYFILPDEFLDFMKVLGIDWRESNECL